MGWKADFTSVGAIGFGALAGLVGTAVLFASGPSNSASKGQSCFSVRSAAPAVVASIGNTVTVRSAAPGHPDAGDAAAATVRDVIVRAPRSAGVSGVDADAPRVVEIRTGDSEAPRVIELRAGNAEAEVAVIRGALTISEGVDIDAECVVEAAEVRDEVDRIRVRSRRNADEMRDRAEDLRSLVDDIRAEAAETGEVDPERIEALVESALRAGLESGFGTQGR